MTGIIQGVMAYALIIALFWAFYDSTTFTRQQYKNVRKLGRVPWLIAMGTAIVMNFWLGGFRFSDPVGGRSLTWIATLLVLIVYLYDLRPKLLAERLAGA
jgi:hypothetical protein